MIYFDNASTTKCDEEIASEILNVMINDFGNPSSLHSMGVSAQLCFEKAQRQVEKAINAKTGKIVFTSGGTESNNLAIFGTVNSLKKRGNRIITTEIEHSSVLGCFQMLEKQGFDVVYLKPDSIGRISPQELHNALTSDTILVSCMYVNNEVGTIQPIEQLVSLTRKIAPLAYFHTDAIQAFGKIPVDVKKLGVDLLSVSGHKVNCSKGIGALYIKEKVNLVPIIYGGGQQMGLKPGTENVPLAVGLGKASEIITCRLNEFSQNAAKIKDKLLELLTSIPEATVISPKEDCSPFILCLSLENYKAETVLHFLEEKGIFVSSGSACSKGKESHVLTAMNVPHSLRQSSIRVSIGRYNTVNEAEEFVSALKEATLSIRKIKK